MIEIVYGDAEGAAIDWLTEALETRWDDPVTVANHLGSTWEPGDTLHVLVQCDGTPGGVHPIEVYQTVRVTVFAQYTTDARALCQIAHAALLAFPGDPEAGIGGAAFLTGVMPGEDPENGAQTASATVRMKVRSKVA